MSEGTDDRDVRARGLARMQEVYNFSVDPEQVPGDFAAITVDHLFGTIWTRPDLDVPERRLLTIGVLAALGQKALLEVQFRSALATGELTEDQVRDVRRLYAEGKFSQLRLAEMFPINQANISKLIRRVAWAHVS